MLPIDLSSFVEISFLVIPDLNHTFNISSSSLDQGLPAFEGLFFFDFFSSKQFKTVYKARTISPLLQTLSSGNNSPVVGSTPSANVAKSRQ